MRKSSRFILLISMLLLALPLSAQERLEWSAYLYDNINNDLLLVRSAGETQTFSLGLPENSYVFGMRINEAGSKVAMCAMEYDYSDPNNSINSYSFMLRDIAAESNLIEMPLGEIAGCNVTAYTSEAIALSIVYYENYMPTATEREGASWELRLLDPNTGESLASLDSENPTMPAIDLYGMEDVPVTAKVFDLSAESVSFIAVPYVGTEFSPELSAFAWNLSTNTVSRLSDSAGRLDADYLPATGELVFSLLDASRAYVTPMGIMSAANTVVVRDAEGNETVIYYNAERSVATAKFVNDGESVLISLLHGYDENTPPPMEEDFSQEFVLVNRDGSIVEFEGSFDGAVYASNIPDGAIFIYTPNPTAESPEWKATQIHILTPDGVLAFDTAVLPDYADGYSSPALVWTSPSAIPSDLAPFVGE